MCRVVLKDLIEKYPEGTTLAIDFGGSGCCCTIKQFNQLNFGNALEKEVIRFKYYPPIKNNIQDTYDEDFGTLEIILKCI